MAEDIIGHARDAFFTVLPVATGIITYWFTSRRKSRDEEPGNGESGDENRDAGEQE